MKHFGFQYGLLSLFILLKVKGQSITITPQTTAIVRYGNELNLTCVSSESTGAVGFYYIDQINNEPVNLGVAVFSFKQCKNESDSVTLFCDFKTNTIMVTLFNPLHNQKIFCKRSFNRTENETFTTIYVQVPVSTVILSPLSKVEVDENTTITFSCLVYGCRPEANISWYGIDNKIVPTTPVSQPNGSLFDVKSTLTISFERNEIGKTIYCTANNIKGDEPIKSREAEIDVKYAPASRPQLKERGSLFVDEGSSITLLCSLSTLGNPAIRWNWFCGDNNLTNEATNNMTLSTLVFKATRKYNRQTCQCLATSPRPSLHYNSSSEEKNITVYFSPSTKPNLTEVSSLDVDEDMSITIRCSLPTLGNPAIRWSWLCGNDNLTMLAVNISTYSTLNFKANRKFNQRTCQCLATSPRPSLSYSNSSESTIITVNYAPSSAPSLNIVTQVPVNEGQTITLQCSLSTLSYPAIVWSWICGDYNLTKDASNSMTQSTLNLTANRTYNLRECQCWATSPRLSLKYNKSSEPKTIIVHFAVEIKQVLFKEGSNNMTAGNPLRIKAEIYGSPDSTVIWKIKDSNNILMQQESVSTFSEFIQDKVTCLHTNDYTVTANNSVGRMAFMDISLNVLCAPYLSIDTDLEPVVVGDENKFVIKQNFIANPTPTILWEKIEMSKGSTIQNGSQHVIILNFLNGKVNYTTILERKNVTMSDVGLYNLYLENGLGNYSSITEVIFKRSPDIPSNVSVSCSEPFKARVSWIAEFDGGGTQSFLIAFSQTNWNTEKINPVVTSGEKGENKFVTISDLQPNIEHRFKVYANNSYGNVSTKSVYCRIIDAKGEDTLPLIASTVAVSSLVIIVVIVTTIFLYRRRGLTFNKARNSNVRLNNDNEYEENDEDDGGLKENSLYVSAGPRDNETPEVVVYAAVAKKLPQSDNNSNVYADVRKSRRQETNKRTISSEVKPKKGLFKKDEKAKHKKGKKPKNRPGEADVYENSDDIAMSTNVDNVYSNAEQKGQNKQKERGYKNKDGLLYVEVNFDGKQGQDNPVIHGEDEKTDYATVEFPMPSALHKASGSEEL